jgi:hypothetical protein
LFVALHQAGRVPAFLPYQQVAVANPGLMNSRAQHKVAALIAGAISVFGNCWLIKRSR